MGHRVQEGHRMKGKETPGACLSFYPGKGRGFYQSRQERTINLNAHEQLKSMLTYCVEANHERERDTPPPVAQLITKTISSPSMLFPPKGSVFFFSSVGSFAGYENGTV